LSDSMVWRFATNCKEPKPDIHSRAKKECVYNWELSINVTPPKYTTTKCFGPSRKSQRGKVLKQSLRRSIPNLIQKMWLIFVECIFDYYGDRSKLVLALWVFGFVYNQSPDLIYLKISK
jgi:hypothetical protein